VPHATEQKIEERELARAWSIEIERRAARVRNGQSDARPADEVFQRTDEKLRSG
jgi:hypothetical protein